MHWTAEHRELEQQYLRKTEDLQPGPPRAHRGMREAVWGWCCARRPGPLDVPQGRHRWRALGDVPTANGEPAIATTQARNTHATLHARSTLSVGSMR